MIILYYSHTSSQLSTTFRKQSRIELLNTGCKTETGGGKILYIDWTE